jgi:hypothetical protein
MLNINKKISILLSSVVFFTALPAAMPVFADTTSTSKSTITMSLEESTFISHLKNGEFKEAKADILNNGEGIISGTAPYDVVVGTPNNSLGIVYISNNLAIYYLNDTLVEQYNTIGNMQIEYIDEATGKDIIPSTSIITTLYAPDYTKPEVGCSYDLPFSELRIPGYKLDTQNATTINQKGMKDLSIEQKTWVNLYASSIPLEVNWFNTAETPVVLKLHYTKIN